ncbi:RES domain-containing protein [Pseudobutyrivibrio sp. OR37]|uniref:RES domain-containing protein n=1 Tax=Pseudobutyrivibrio sp. OR37 TaxID=1798186 RepID=UPI0008F0A462|nr:RES domain-containing protein [Pseudobutyrivibrio sp. OR37]SFI24446.1 RES domain-containing protein [Pseudobutyrivibrio sp. OR37]
MTSAESYMNVSEVLGQFSESTKKTFAQINTDGMTSALKIAAEQLRPLENISGQLNSALRVAQVQMSVQPVVSQMIGQKYIDANVFSNGSFALQLADIQSQLAVLASLPTATPMLKEVQIGFANSNISACVGALQNSLNGISMEMPDFSFFRTSELIKSLGHDLSLPTGFASALAGLNKSSAERLAYNDNIIYRNDIRRFVSVTNTDDNATSSELNVICRAEDFLDVTEYEEKFTENELMNFMSYLDEHPMMAMKSEIGERIFSLINEFPYVINFDRDCYYHCRARLKDEAPYVWEQMRRAPYGVTYPGRYNHSGQSYFYFSDKVEGAQNEIRKHMTKDDEEQKVLQTVEVGVNTNVRLIDLSEKNRRGLNTFFKYIRFPLKNDSGKRPREYLIPSFVAECCRMVGINGIKYYGGKDYSNYVTWEDGYYEFRRNI